MFILSLNTGIMVGYALSSLFDYKTVGCMVVGLPIASSLLSFFFLSETPQFLLKYKKDEAAAKSLKFYRNCNKTTTLKDIQDVDAELKSMKIGVIEAQGKSDKITVADFSKYIQCVLEKILYL